MNKRPNEQQVFDTVLGAVVEALRIDRKRVTADARFFVDLEAESIDIVDIRFRIEEAFGIKTKQEEFFESLGSDLTRTQIEEKFTVGSLVAFIVDRLAVSKKG
jgi:acyl carrier protein